MTEKTMTRCLVAALILSALIWVFTAPASATEKSCVGNSCRDLTNVSTVVTGGSQTSTNTTTFKGSKAMALSGADMDINDCLATYSAFFGLWQGTHINAMCEAERLNQQGQYREAAMMKCSTRKFRKVYGKGSVCVAAIMLEVTPEPIVESESQLEDDAEYHEQIDAQAEVIATQQRELETVNERLETLEKRRATSTTTVNQVGLTDAQRQELAEVFAK